MAGYAHLSHQERLEVDIYRLVRMPRHTERLMKEADMVISCLDDPSPCLAMDIVVREVIQSFNVAKLVHHR